MELVHLLLSDLSRLGWINTVYRLWCVPPLHPTFSIVFPHAILLSVKVPLQSMQQACSCCTSGRAINGAGAHLTHGVSPWRGALVHAAFCSSCTKPVMLLVRISLAQSFTSLDWFGETSCWNLSCPQTACYLLSKTADIKRSVSESLLLSLSPLWSALPSGYHP